MTDQDAVATLYNAMGLLKPGLYGYPAEFDLYVDKCPDSLGLVLVVETPEGRREISRMPYEQVRARCHIKQFCEARDGYLSTLRSG